MLEDVFNTFLFLRCLVSVAKVFAVGVLVGPLAWIV